MKIILMRLRITIAMLEIRNRETLQSKVNICKSDVKIGDYADSLCCGLTMGLIGPTVLLTNKSIDFFPVQPSDYDKTRSLLIALNHANLV